MPPATIERPIEKRRRKQRTNWKSSPRIKFADEAANEVVAVAMAKVGASTVAIQKKTFLSPSQIAYRLNKAKVLEGRETGYRIAFRNGDSPEFKRIMKDYVAVLKIDVAEKLSRLVISSPQNGKIKLLKG
jgi:hypothetical protein